jgi:tRNA 2-thiouridine synthesizing protein A
VKVKALQSAYSLFSKGIQVTEKNMLVALDIDTKGLRCPMPMLRTKKALAKLNSGDVVRVTATDSHAAPDLQQFCEQTGHKLLSVEDKGEVWDIYIEKK